MIEAIDLGRCNGCGMCDPVCPADVIHMTPAAEIANADPAGPAMIPVIRYRQHCITCFNCEIFCPTQAVDVHPSIKNRPRPW